LKKQRIFDEFLIKINGVNLIKNRKYDARKRDFFTDIYVE